MCRSAFSGHSLFALQHARSVASTSSARKWFSAGSGSVVNSTTAVDELSWNTDCSTPDGRFYGESWAWRRPPIAASLPQAMPSLDFLLGRQEALGVTADCYRPEGARCRIGDSHRPFAGDAVVRSRLRRSW